LTLLTPSLTLDDTLVLQLLLPLPQLPDLLIQLLVYSEVVLSFPSEYSVSLLSQHILQSASELPLEAIFKAILKDQVFNSIGIFLGI